MTTAELFLAMLEELQRLSEAVAQLSATVERTNELTYTSNVILSEIRQNLED